MSNNNKKVSEWLTFLFTIRDKGADFILIEYSGGGDEGHVDSVTFYPRQFVQGKFGEEDFSVVADAHEDPTIEKLKKDCEPYKEKIEEDVYRQLLANIEDWYNNDGGSGEVWIDTKTGKYWCKNSINYTETKDYIHTGSF